MSDLPDISTAPASWHLDRCAEVRVGDHVTRYARRGSGLPAIVVVGANAEREPIWAPLVEAMAATHRVVVPQPPPVEADYVSWLRGFIEGIGLAAVVLIAGGTARDSALELTMADAFTFRGLVLIAGAADSTPRADGTTRTDAPDTFLVLPEWSPADAVQRVERFIAGLDAAP